MEVIEMTILEKKANIYKTPDNIEKLKKNHS